ncbi:hypothetical protein B0H19DRAFT_1275824 [Mycena capillaripes]|nr:hypothetical protein B0H19DRAFT_1275824 [Mycena capillaripes]
MRIRAQNNSTGLRHLILDVPPYRVPFTGWRLLWSVADGSAASIRLSIQVELDQMPVIITWNCCQLSQITITIPQDLALLGYTAEIVIKSGIFKMVTTCQPPYILFQTAIPMELDTPGSTNLYLRHNWLEYFRDRLIAIRAALIYGFFAEGATQISIMINAGGISRSHQRTSELRYTYIPAVDVDVCLSPHQLLSTSASSGMFSTPSGSSSGASLARTQTKTSMGSSRSRPRPRSPPSMYVAYESASAKAPKPLIKLDKKSKNKSAAKTSDPPNPFPIRSYTLPTPPAAPDKPPQRRPSVSSFLSLRRKTAAQPPSVPVVPSREEFSALPPLRVPLPRPVHLHQTNIHPVDDVDDLPPIPRPSDKAARMLGKPLPQHQPARDDRSIIESDYSDGFSISARSSESATLDGETSSFGDGSSIEDDDECYADDVHIRRESRLLSPIEFASARPQSMIQPPAPLASDTASDFGVDEEWEEPITPVAPLPPHMRTDPQLRHARGESYASVHDHYSNQPTRDSTYMQFRPDTPFLDALVAVNSQVVVARGAPRAPRHAREPSVIRTEPKQGWMGEWNQEDMQDVIHKLRSLK